MSLKGDFSSKIRKSCLFNCKSLKIWQSSCPTYPTGFLERMSLVKLCIAKQYFCIVCLFRWTARRNRLINTSQIAIPLNWDFAYVRKQIYLCTNCPDLDEMNMCLVKNFIPLHIQCGKKESATNSKFQQIKMISYCVVCDNFQYKAFKQVLLKKFVKTH